MISAEEAVDKCLKLQPIESPGQLFIDELYKYFSGEANNICDLTLPFKALHRADLFLFSLPALTVETEKLLDLTKTWFALISTLLLLDDAEDYLDDKKKGEENAFIESGSDKEGFEKIKEMLTINIDHITRINSSMAYSLNRKLMSIGDKAGIKEYLNA
jgi:hypothetical protein